jgi:hypothetical protein
VFSRVDKCRTVSLVWKKNEQSSTIASRELVSFELKAESYSKMAASESKSKSFPTQFLSLGKGLYVIIGVFNGWPSIAVRVCGLNEKTKVPYPKPEGSG